MVDAITHMAAAVVLGLIFMICCHDVSRAVRDGRTRLRGWPEAVRATGPVWFWLCTGFQAAVGVMCLSALVVAIVQSL